MLTSSSSSLGLLVLVVVVAFPFQRVAGNGVFELRFKSFVNERRLNAKGNCCGGDAASDSRPCPVACATFFRVCLKHFQSTINVEDDCTFGSAETRVLGADSFQMSPETGVVSVDISFAWLGDFTLILEAWHGFPEREGSRPELITRMAATRTLRKGDTWVDETHRDGAISLDFSYRFVCQPNYYGEKCKDYCRPRDDNHGHYDCSANGTKVCKTGWTGEFCNIAICLEECSTEHGYCEEPNQCKCRPGWKGRFCTECMLYPGCDKGTCVKAYDCICDPGWGGMFCNQDLNYCTHNKPCQNGGTCINSGQGGFTCQCPDGYKGDRCEVLIPDVTCRLQDCLNNGECKETSSGVEECVCPTGFYGRFCELGGLTCEDRPCQNGATCVPKQSDDRNSQRDFVCMCPPGYNGFTCGNSVCEKNNPCLNGGKCSTDESGAPVCQCPAGYAGSRCGSRQSACSSSPCVNGGTCFDLTGGGYKCQCPATHVGRNCEDNYRACKIRPCTNGGTCYDLDAGEYRCQCPSGFTGDKCEKDEDECANGNPCVHGTCNNVLGTYQCVCDAGFTGANCDQSAGVSIGTPLDQPRPTSERSVDDALTVSELVAVVCLGVGVTFVILVVVVFILCRQRRARLRQAEEVRSQNERNERMKLNNKTEELNRNLALAENGEAASMLTGAGGGCCANNAANRLTPTSVCNNVFDDASSDAAGKDYDKRAFSPNGAAFYRKDGVNQSRSSQRGRNSVAGTLPRLDKNQQQQQQQQCARTLGSTASCSATKELSVEQLVSKYHQRPQSSVNVAAAAEKDSCAAATTQQPRRQQCSSPYDLHRSELTKVDNRAAAASASSASADHRCSGGVGVEDVEVGANFQNNAPWLTGLVEAAPAPAPFPGANQNSKNLSHEAGAFPADQPFPVFTIAAPSHHTQPSSLHFPNHHQHHHLHHHHHHLQPQSRPTSPPANTPYNSQQQQQQPQSQFGSDSCNVDNAQLSTAV